MPGYTVRCPYRVDEPKLGFEEHELRHVEWMRGEPSGCLLGGSDKNGSPDGVVERFAPGAWTRCWWGPYADDVVPIQPLDPDLQDSLGHHGRKARDLR